jgi:hypothetical protein
MTSQRFCSRSPSQRAYPSSAGALAARFFDSTLSVLSAATPDAVPFSVGQYRAETSRSPVPIAHWCHIHATAAPLGWLRADFGGGLFDERPTT